MYWPAFGNDEFGSPSPAFHCIRVWPLTDDVTLDFAEDIKEQIEVAFLAAGANLDQVFVIETASGRP